MVGVDSVPNTTRRTLEVAGKQYTYYSLNALQELGLKDVQRLPFSLKVLLENLLRQTEKLDRHLLQAVIQAPQQSAITTEIAFSPARVLMQDFTGVPGIVDLAAMREALKTLKNNPARINPLIPVDLVIDHSVMVDAFGHPQALNYNVAQEFKRNHERYKFLYWGKEVFRNFRVIPPGTGICHQVNLEYLAKVVWTAVDELSGERLVYPDTLIGTDSHTTMVNGLAVLGWGVGGIEAEAAMLGQPLSLLIPSVVGVKLTGSLPEGTTATDLVLTVTNILRTKGVVGKFVEFYGSGIQQLSLEDRATIANMAPEYGATCGFFPIDAETLRYLRFTGREAEQVMLVETYAKKQGLWHDPLAAEPRYNETVELNLTDVLPTMAGPKRPQDKVFLKEAKISMVAALEKDHKKTSESYAVTGQSFNLRHGDVIIAAITSCTNTSNPFVMVSAGLLARNARQLGLKTKPWVKTSLAPGSQVVTHYLSAACLDEDLDALGFNLVGYGCTTCIGNSGPITPEMAEVIERHDLNVCAVLSGNRNFEGRINPYVKSNYLASPPLVVAYALSGSLLVDLTQDPLGEDAKSQPVYLKDIWPSSKEVTEVISQFISPQMFRDRYEDVFKGSLEWQSIHVKPHLTYSWNSKSTYIQPPPYFSNVERTPTDIMSARILALLGDSITTDHISPAGSIKPSSPAGLYLQAKNVSITDFNSYGARRGNHEVMIRGTFANARLVNEMVPDRTGGYTRFMPTQEVMSIYEAAMRYQQQEQPLIIISGKEYGTGSSRDWAAKGTYLLGVKAIIAESFERIHRSNLIGMGVLPLQFEPGVSRKTLGLSGQEVIDIQGINQRLSPHLKVTCRITRSTGEVEEIPLICRLETQEETTYYQHGGILPYVLRTYVGQATKNT